MAFPPFFLAIRLKSKKQFQPYKAHGLIRPGFAYEITCMKLRVGHESLQRAGKLVTQHGFPYYSIVSKKCDGRFFMLGL
jgi:hypothetical protein